MTPLCLLLLLVAFIVVWLAWLLFIFIFPATWSRFIDWEHSFFLNRGLISKDVSDGMKRLEKGFVLQLFLGATILFALMSLSLVVGRYFLGLRI